MKLSPAGKRTVLVIATSIALFISYGMGDTNARNEVEMASQATASNDRSCFDQLWSLNDRMLKYYNGILEWQNAGYALDDYTAGSLNAQISQWNADKDTYNSTCASEGLNAKTQ